MKKVLDFLGQLRKNNNRDWFEANKAQYKEALAGFNGFVEQLIPAIESFDESVRGLTLRDCTYRIYRDVRFSLNKDPYKTHMGAFICPKGKKSGYAGYYFHVEPRGDGMVGSSMLSIGVYMAGKDVLQSVREEILDNGEQFEAAMKEAKGFEMDFSDSLKRLPQGFPAGSPYEKYLKLKHVGLNKMVDDSFMLDKNLLDNTVNAFKSTARFNAILNKAIRYAYEEMS